MLLVAGLVVAVFVFEGLNEAPPERSEVQQFALECEQTLKGRMDEAVFDGADSPGSPAHALAEYVKWSWMGPLKWIGRRDDLRMIVGHGSAFLVCYQFDTRGYIVAMHRRHEQSQSTKWITRGEADGRLTLTFYEQDPGVLEGEVTAWYTLTASPGTSDITTQLLAGRSAGLKSVDGTYTYDVAQGHLELTVRQEGRVVVGPDGLPVASYSRTCYDPQLPCEDPWETTLYTFDANGNLTKRDIDFGDEKQHDELVLKVNGRGHWIEWRFASTPDEKVLDRRTIFYRE